MTEDEMVGWHHQLNEHEFEQTPGAGEGQVGIYSLPRDSFVSNCGVYCV